MSLYAPAAHSVQLGHAQYNTLTRSGNTPGLNMSDEVPRSRYLCGFQGCQRERESDAGLRG